MTSVCAAVLRRISVLTNRSISRSSSGVTGCRCENSNRRRSAPTTDPCSCPRLSTPQGQSPVCRPSDLASGEPALRVTHPPAAQVHAKLARFLRTLALLFHCSVEARLVNRQPALARDVRGQVRRETIRVIQLE